MVYISFNLILGAEFIKRNFLKKNDTTTFYKIICTKNKMKKKK